MQPAPRTVFDFNERTLQDSGVANEVAFIEQRLERFAAPRLADGAPPLSPEEDLLFQLLINRRTAIMIDLVKFGEAP